MRDPFWTLGLVFGLVLSACAGPSFDGRVYRGNGLAFRIGPLPDRWRALQADDTLLAFHDERQGATIAVNGRCGVDGDDVPLRALTHHLFLHFTDRRVIDQRALTLDGREALRTEMSAELDGVPRRFVVYVLKKNQCVYDFMWIGADTATAATGSDFQRFVQGFSTEI